MLALLSVGAWASEVTLNMNNVDLTWTAVGDDQTTTSQGITIYYAKSGSYTPTSQGLTANHIRFYRNSSVTISAASPIIKIVFTAVSGFDAANLIPEVGTNNGGTWTGNATEIKFNLSVAQVRVTKMVVTLEDGTVAAPYFTPAGGTYYSPTDVTIKAQEGSTINYTLDGSTPTTASAVYSEPIHVTATTTIKAIATLNGVTSDVATSTYTMETPQSVANIAAFAALADNTNAGFSNPVVVTYVNGQNTYVKDATGFMCIYGNEISGKYGQGDVIPAGFGGLKTTYNNGVEMYHPLFGFEDATDSQAVEPDEVTVANFGSSQMWQYVVLRGAQITYYNGRYLGFRVDNSTDSVAGYNQFNLALPDASGTYDIYGIVSSYKGDIQMYPIDFVDVNPTAVGSIAELMALEQGKSATFTTPVTAVYHSDKRLYIKDVNDDFMLVYGSLANTYNNGDVLNGIAGNWTIHNGLTEIIPVASTFGEATAGTAVEPELITIEEIDQSMIHHYLRMENCTIAAIEGDTRNFTLTDETGNMIMRLNFSEVTIGEDFDFTANYNVEGFLAYFESTNGETQQLQFYPNKIEKISPYDFKVDELCYIINADGTTVTVTHESQSIHLYPPAPTYQDISGEIVVPERVTYNGITYLVTRIDNWAFYHCSGITSVIIPNTVTTIGNSAFYSCTGLTSLIISNSVHSISASAFKDCNNLTSITLSGQGAWNLDNYDYSGLLSIINQLKTVNIGCEISSIGGFGFAPTVVNCYAETPPSCVSTTFANYNGHLHVPPISTVAYFTADYWQNFLNLSNDLSFVTLDKTQASLVQWETVTLTATVIPEASEVIWSTSNADVATVDDNGVVTAIKEGECDIFASLASTNGAGYAKCNIVVTYPEISLSLSEDSLELNVGEESTLTVTVIPNNTGLTPSWASSDESVATVQNGLITATGEGECDITATILNKTATCHLIVGGNVSITLNIDHAILGSNQILTVYPSCSPNVPIELVVTSSDPNVAIARVVDRMNAPARELLNFSEENSALNMIEQMPAPSNIKAPALASDKAIMVAGVQYGTATITVTTVNGKSDPVSFELRVVDVNGDRIISSTDVTSLYNYLIHGDETYINTSDVDGDGFITGVDITVIYNLLLGN